MWRCSVWRGGGRGVVSESSGYQTRFVRFVARCALTFYKAGPNSIIVHLGLNIFLFGSGFRPTLSIYV